MFPRMHASIYVSNLERSVEFYNRFFHTPPEKKKAGYAKYHLSTPDLVFSLVEYPERVAGNFGHQGIQVESPELLEGMKEQALASNVLSYEEKDVACCYAKQDKFWAVDPDGIQWEVYYFHEDVDFNDPAFSRDAGEKDACCSTAFSLEDLPEAASIETLPSNDVSSQSGGSQSDGLPGEAEDNEPVAAGACCEPGCCGK